MDVKCGETPKMSFYPLRISFFIYVGSPAESAQYLHLLSPQQPSTNTAIETNGQKNQHPLDYVVLIIYHPYKQLEMLLMSILLGKESRLSVVEDMLRSGR